MATLLNNKYRILRKLGEGSTSFVYLGSYQEALYAIKIIKKSYVHKNMDDVKNEIKT